MADLRELLQRASGAGGLAHQLAIDDVRLYMRTRSIDDTIAEMHRIEEPLLLRHLAEAGLRGPFFREFMDILAKLRERGIE